MTSFKPSGWPTVIPRLFTPDAAGLVAFLRAVFAAEGEERVGAPAEMRIGDSMIMVSDGGGQRDAQAAFLYVYVADADKAYRTAIELGAEMIEAPIDTPYGDRRAMIRDRWGNTWQIATRRVSRS
ncbi:MAG: VOC family protein [Alphaproteobacteria bacterium]|nr:VOC family protein [Alphaproteobacteria bacterium]